MLCTFVQNLEIMITRSIVLLLNIVFPLMLIAQETHTTDSIKPAKRNIVQKFIDYINDTDTESHIKDNNKISWNFIGGPYYSSDEKFSIAITGTAEYYSKGCKEMKQPSYSTLYAAISTAGFWKIGSDGTNFFNNDKQRLNYSVRFGYSPRNYWGIGYEPATHDDNYINLKQNDANIHVEYIMALAPNFYVGPAAEWNYNKAGKIENIEFLQGQDRVVRNYGAGFVVQYDTRDLITNASKGVYAHLSTICNPKFLWNKYAFTTVDFTTSYYHTAWKDAIIAGQLNAKFNFGNPSWAMMSLYGGNEIMRGYYKGRFRDKHMASAQVELRQHVWKRSGMVLWGGVGTVFHDSDSFCNKLLPNYGIGYRFEFRKRMNIRLDLGFGAHGQSGVIFSMNEAF